MSLFSHCHYVAFTCGCRHPMLRFFRWVIEVAFSSIFVFVWPSSLETSYVRWAVRKEMQCSITICHEKKRALDAKFRCIWLQIKLWINLTQSNCIYKRSVVEIYKRKERKRQNITWKSVLVVTWRVNLNKTNLLAVPAEWYVQWKLPNQPFVQSLRIMAISSCSENAHQPESMREADVGWLSEERSSFAIWVNAIRTRRTRAPCMPGPAALRAVHLLKAPTSGPNRRPNAAAYSSVPAAAGAAVRVGAVFDHRCRWIAGTPWTH